MRRGTIPKIAILCLSVLQGGYMAFDGAHKLLTGNYFGGHLGPWAYLLAVFGISPAALAPVFVALGALWLLAAAALLLNRGGSRTALTLLSILSLAYLIFGTVLSILILVLLFTLPRKASKRRPRPRSRH